jgi:hypothetical protein
MKKIPPIAKILDIDPFDTRRIKYKGCEIFGFGDPQRICVEFADPDLFLVSLLDQENKINLGSTDVRLILWKDRKGNLVRFRAIARYHTTLRKNEIPTRSLVVLDREKFLVFLQNYPDLIEWYLFNPFDIKI